MVFGKSQTFSSGLAKFKFLIGAHRLTCYIHHPSVSRSHPRYRAVPAVCQWLSRWMWKERSELRRTLRKVQFANDSPDPELIYHHIFMFMLHNIIIQSVHRVMSIIIFLEPDLPILTPSRVPTELESVGQTTESLRPNIPSPANQHISRVPFLADRAHLLPRIQRTVFRRPFVWGYLGTPNR